jgi:hypothetical protein
MEEVAGVCGIHAQVMTAGEMSLGARVGGVTRQSVQSALWEKKSLVKLWAMRGTLHIVPAADLTIFTKGLSWIDENRRKKYLAQRGLQPGDVDYAVEAVADALDGRTLRKKELLARMVKGAPRRLVPWIESSWGAALLPSCRAGLLCHGPSVGGESTFVRADQWLGWRQQISDEEARKELLRRHLSAYGPATRQEFAAWAGLDGVDVKSTWGAMEGELTEVRVNGSRAWILTKDVQEIAAARLRKPVKLLPLFDVYLLQRNREQLVGPSDYKKVYRDQAWISAVVLERGRIAGVWAHRRKAKSIEMTVTPFRPVTRALRHGISTEAEQLGRFLGLPVTVQVA